jgi:hypothetical protein
MRRSAGPDADDPGITIAAPGWFSVLERIAVALERIADFVELGTDPPGLAPAGPLILVDKGVEVSFTMSDIPIGKDGIQRLNPGDYDGPVAWTVLGGPATVVAATPDGLAGRITLADGAAVGDEIRVRAQADIRHGADTVLSDADFVYSVVAADAAPLTGAGFEVVDKMA